MFIRASALPAPMALHTLRVYYSQWAFLIVAMSISNCRRGDTRLGSAYPAHIPPERLRFFFFNPLHPVHPVDPCLIVTAQVSLVYHFDPGFPCHSPWVVSL